MIVCEMNKGLRVWMSCCAYSHTTLSRMTPIEVRWQKEMSCDKIQGDPLDFDFDAADDADDKARAIAIASWYEIVTTFGRHSSLARQLAGSAGDEATVKQILVDTFARL